MFNPDYRITPTLLSTLKRIAILVHDLNKRSLDDGSRAEVYSEARVVSAYASSTIRGHSLPLLEVKELLKQSPESPQPLEREILNYNNTLKHLENKPLTEDLVFQLHRDLMAGLLAKEKCGVYREESVVINDPSTNKVIFLPPNPKDIPRLMQELFEFVDVHSAHDPVILAGLFHRQFMTLHPFSEGNGRTVRLASTVLLRDLGLNFFDALSFEHYYQGNLSRYFQSVTERGNYYEVTSSFTTWLEYFAIGVLHELMRLEKRLEQEPSLRLKDHQQRLLEYLDQHGSITDKDYAKIVERAKATRALDFRNLLERGLIRRKGKGPGTYYIKTEM